MRIKKTLRFFVFINNRLPRIVAAGNDKRKLCIEFAVKSHGRQEHAHLIGNVCHVFRKPGCRILFFLTQYNGTGCRLQQCFFFCRDITKLFCQRYIRNHHGKRLGHSLFQIPQTRYNFRLVCTAEKIKSSHCLDHDDLALGQQFAGGGNYVFILRLSVRRTGKRIYR